MKFQDKEKTNKKHINLFLVMFYKLTLLVAQRLLQHGQDDRVVQHKVAEVAKSGCTQSGVADQRVFV